MMGLSLGLSLSGRAAGGAAPPTGLTYVQPANIANLWDPALIGATDGQALTGWTDTIGGVTATTPSGSPVYKTSAYGGKPGVRCAGSQWFDLGRNAAMLATMAGDYTMMWVVSNLVTGANSNSGIFAGGNTGSFWLVLNLTNIGKFSGGTTPNPLAATDLYVVFYTARRSGFNRLIAGVNGTSFFPNDVIDNTGTNNLSLGTCRTDTVANGNTYSLRGDILWGAMWNTNLSYTDIIRQTRKIFSYFGKSMPWTGVSKFMLCDGDSITKGTNGLTNANYPFFSAANLGRKFGEWSNNGRPSATMATLSADFNFQYAGLSGADALGIPVVCTWMEYANQRGTSGTIPYDTTNAYANLLKATDPTMTSVFMTSTALGGTTAGQGDQTADGALGTNASAQGTYRVTYSEFFTNTPNANMDLVIPLHRDAAIGQIGANPYTPDVNNLNFSNNTTHPLGIVGQNAANGYARIAALHSAAIAPLL